jgi:diguanylate cyclase (GGDEF)-like protein/PAS domain S-box-containing protein
MQKILAEWFKQLSIATLYVLLGHAVHHYFTHHGIGIIWPNSGMALAIVLIGGKRYIWAVLLGSIMLHAPFKESFWVIGGVSAANVLQVLLGNCLLKCREGGFLSLYTLRNYFRLIFLGGFAASLVSAIITPAIFIGIQAIPASDYFAFLIHWWMGNSLGVVVFAPLILIGWQRKLEPYNSTKNLETLLLMGLSFMAGQIIFLGWFSENFTIPPKGFIMFLPITWIAIRLSMLATCFVLNMTAVQALSGAYLKTGYFANDIATSNLYNYWLYILILSGVGMVMAIYINELKQNKNDLAVNNKRLNALIEAIPDAIFFKDAKSRWLITNEPAKQLFKLHDIPWRNKTEMELADLHPAFRAAHEACLVDDEKAWEAAKLSLFSETVLTEQGDVRHFEVRKKPVFNEQGQRQALVIIGRDITDKKQAEDQLRIAAATFETHEAIMITDCNANIIRVNQAFEKITGYSSAEVLGKNPRILKSGQHDRRFYSQMWQGIQSGSWNGELWDKHKNGTVYPKELTITAVKNPAGEITQYVCIFNDITERKKAEEEIKYLAFFDYLTGLPNRRLLMDRLKHALATSVKSYKKGALLFIDIDNFKSLNDTLGHDTGDLLLKQVAQRLNECVSEDDTVARLGGDEFVIIFEGLSQQAIEAGTKTEMLGEKILARLALPYTIAEQNYYCTSSIGAVLYHRQETSSEELLKQADIAMYQAKASGRNTLRFFDPQMQICINARVAMEADLRLALAENQFQLYYQLQIKDNRQATGAEVLLRWIHPTRGMVSPADFIPLAEESGLIVSIGAWVLETACAQLKRWENNEQTQHLQLAVNVSAKQFHQVNFVEQVSEILTLSAIKPKRLKLELTESLVLDNVDETIQKMDALRKMGVRFSMDDFGTGYSSLAYLTQLPLDQLKIDQSFVRNLGVKPSDAVIVQTIIGMANNLGIDVIAEGVETAEQCDFLQQHGCLQYQGYFFSKPVPLDLFEKLIR